MILHHIAVPQSTIVHDTVGQNELRRLAGIAKALYEKYIRRHSELEINIDWALRNRWDSLHFRNYPERELAELVNVVDETISEMIKYVRESLMRFNIDR